MLPAERNLALSRRYFEELFNKNRLELADEIFTPNFVDHDPASPKDLGKGPQAVRRLTTMYRTAFPDAKITIEDIFSNGSEVVVRWKAQGTHKGELMGIKATGKAIKITGIDIHRYENGRIAENWTQWDRYGMMEQLGVFSPQIKRKAA